jgi:hypothetical protein
MIGLRNLIKGVLSLICVLLAEVAAVIHLEVLTLGEEVAALAAYKPQLMHPLRTVLIQ